MTGSSREGDFVYETAGSRHSFQGEAGADTEMFVLLDGSLEFLDESGNIAAIEDWRTMLQRLEAHCKAHGIAVPELSEFPRAHGDPKRQATQPIRRNCHLRPDAGCLLARSGSGGAAGTVQVRAPWPGTRRPCLPTRRAWRPKRGWHAGRLAIGRSGSGRAAEVRWLSTRRRRGIASCRSPRQRLLPGKLKCDGNRPELAGDRR